jgi:hypothetical protein
MMSDVQRHPIDFERLSKGDVIPVNRIEEIVGVKRDDKNYSILLLQLKGRVERELFERKKLWTLTTEAGEIKILTDAEASAYNAIEAENARRRERRRFALQCAVDVGELTEEQKSEHRRRVEIQGRYIQAQTGVRKQLRLEDTKRNVPGLPAHIMVKKAGPNGEDAN